MQEVPKRIHVGDFKIGKEEKTAINEVLKRPEIQNILKKDRIAKEMILIEDLLRLIAVNGPAVYGINETEHAAQAGAVKVLMLTDSFIKKTRIENKYQRLEGIMQLTDKMKGSIYIISHEHEGGKRLDGLGGIAAILRYKIS